MSEYKTTLRTSNIQGATIVSRDHFKPTGIVENLAVNYNL